VAGPLRSPPPDQARPGDGWFLLDWQGLEWDATVTIRDQRILWPTLSVPGSQTAINTAIRPRSIIRVVTDHNKPLQAEHSVTGGGGPARCPDRTCFYHTALVRGQPPISARMRRSAQSDEGRSRLRHDREIPDGVEWKRACLMWQSITNGRSPNTIVRVAVMIAGDSL